MTQAIKNIVHQYLQTECGLDKDLYTDESSIFISGLLDSIDVIQLIVFLEKRFSIKINAFNVSLETLDSVTKVASYLEANGVTACA